VVNSDWCANDCIGYHTCIDHHERYLTPEPQPLTNSSQSLDVAISCETQGAQVDETYALRAVPSHDHATLQILANHIQHNLMYLALRQDLALIRLGL